MREAVELGRAGADQAIDLFGADEVAVVPRERERRGETLLRVRLVARAA